MDSTCKTALFIFVISLAAYTAFQLLQPPAFIYDEGAYSLMIKEFSDNPLMVMPTICGEHTEWKPPLFTWIYAPFYMFFNYFSLPPEMPFRLPSALFAATGVSLVFLITSRLYGDDAAKAAALLFATSPLIFNFSHLAMMEAFSVSLILASIYFYLAGKDATGSLALALLTLTKWLYVAAPILFVTIYFLKNKQRLRAIIPTFISVPAALIFYLALAAAFGSLGNAISILFLDVLRPIPTANVLWLGAFFGMSILVTFPLSILFAFFCIFTKKKRWDEWALIAVGALAFVMPVSQHFIFWYSIISVPAFAIFLGKMIADSFGSGTLFSGLVLALACANIVTCLYLGSFFSPFEAGVREVSIFMQNKSAYILELNAGFPNWKSITEEYAGTEKAFLVLEQRNPGFLFYRFAESRDYQNVHALFAARLDPVPCAEYLIVHRDLYAHDASIPDAAIPPCYALAKQIGNYDLYVHAENASALAGTENK